MPATAKLLATIAGLPHGAVVLPGLDTDLDDAVVESVSPAAQRQARMTACPPSATRSSPCRRCSTRIGIARDDVAEAGRTLTAWPRETGVGGIASGRRPPSAGRRSATRADFGAATDNAPGKRQHDRGGQRRRRSARHRGRLREALETPGKSAALVTPDRALARRVAPRWSAGMSRSTIPAATPCPTRRPACSRGSPPRRRWAGLEPVTLLALLKHPLLRLGAAEGAHATRSRRWNARCCAGRGRSPVLQGLPHALADVPRHSRRHAPQRSALADRAGRTRRRRRVDRTLAAALAPLETLKRGDHALAALARSASQTSSPISAGRRRRRRLPSPARRRRAGRALSTNIIAKPRRPPSLAAGAGDYVELFQRR